jgi:hypothetical protein
MSPPTPLADAAQLDALHRLDQFREWHSLDDKRFCLVCGRIINGRQIRVSGGTRGNGPMLLSCPTEGCNSIPMDWVLPTDEILAVAERGTPEKRSVAPSGTAEGEEEHGLAARLREFVGHFKRSS